MALAAETNGRIDLLLTDWDMPEMSGIALGQTLKLLRPDLHVMQMSGGAHDVTCPLIPAARSAQRGLGRYSRNS
jgi:CheY-like chemotaxis protein